MPPRRPAVGRVPIDVDALRSALAAGKIVRVGISRSAQFPEGAIGRVKGMGYPATDGEEFIQVEVNLNGTRDVLPFTAADLTPATRSRRSTVVGLSPPGDPGGTDVPAAFGPPPAPTHRAPRVPEQSGPIGRQPTPPPGQGRAPHTSAEPPDVVQLTLDGSVVPPALSAAPPQDAGATRTQATDARGKRPRKGQRVSISISTSESEPQWRVEAWVGSRVAVKPTPVQAARVWELVRQLDSELLSSTVGAILEEQRRTTQARADALAAELEVVRAELDSLPTPQ